MAKPKKALDHTGECSYSVGAAGLSVSISAPQFAVAVWGAYKDFRHLVAYVLTDEAGLAIETVKQQGYFGLQWEAELVTLLPPSQ